MKVLVTGATGFIAQHLIAALQTSGHEIIACCRKKRDGFVSYPQLKVIEMDFTLPLSVKIWKRQLDGIDIVINTVGSLGSFDSPTLQDACIKSTCNLFQACNESALKRVIQFSVVGNHEEVNTAYYRRKAAADNYLKTLNIDYSIVRPSLVYGRNGKSTEFFQALAALPMNVFIGKGEQKVQPVYVDDIAKVVISILSVNREGKEEIDVVSPVAINFKEMLAEYRRWLGLSPAKIIDLPSSFTRVIGKVGDLLHLNWCNSENLVMLSAGSTGNPQNFERLLGRPPLSLKEGLAKVSSTQADRLNAKIFFLRPLLRMALAMLWIYTGIVSAGLYPIELSYELLAEVGVGQALAPWFLFGAAGVDIGIGLALLFNYKVKLVCCMQVVIIAVYSAIISIAIPEYWLHPFGPISKNIPLLVAILILQAMEDN